VQQAVFFFDNEAYHEKSEAVLKLMINKTKYELRGLLSLFYQKKIIAERDEELLRFIVCSEQKKYVLPEMLEGFVHESILARAEKKGLAEIRLHNLRDYTLDKWRRVDDYPYGGSAGMVMQCEPIDRCITALKAERDYDEVIFTSPDGERFDQHMANELSLKGNLIILAGHYKGIDQRVRDHLITKEISIGDFVLTGGELVAAMIADAIVRVVPGVIGDEQSALSDCFQDDLLAAPIYTRPAEYKGWKVPEILLSGNEAKIRAWELDQALERTKALRPDLLEK
jgi:tRNA (guanine37-N1)-methyltransferase